MSKVLFMKEEAIKSLLSNVDDVKDRIINNPDNIEWIKEFYNGELFEEKKYEIEDFELKIDNDYSSVDFDNSVLIYEKLKHLPMAVLTDKRFWCWFEFTIGYKAAQKAIPLNDDKENPIKNMWLFSEGNRRSLFFNVIARCFFRVYYSIDENNEDKYKYTRFVIDNPNRFRGFTWRIFSDNRNLVFNAVRAQYDFFNEFKEYNSKWNDKLPKDISYFASVRLIDSVSSDDIYEFVYNKLLQYKEEKD